MGWNGGLVMMRLNSDTFKMGYGSQGVALNDWGRVQLNYEDDIVRGFELLSNKR